MANLTIVVDDQLLQAARVKALQLGTSVNEVCRDAIARFAQPDEDANRHARQLLAIAERARPSSRPAWPGRERLYDEVLHARGLLAETAPKPARRSAR
jgi:hypothetical protein